MDSTIADASNLTPEQKATEYINSIINNELALTDTYELHLEYIGLTNIPEKVRTLDKVRKVFLTGNNIESVKAEEFPKFCSFVCLRNNKIKEFNETSVPNYVSEIDLSYNNLELFDGTKMTSITSLTGPLIPI